MLHFSLGRDPAPSRCDLGGLEQGAKRAGRCWGRWGQGAGCRSGVKSGMKVTFLEGRCYVRSPNVGAEDEDRASRALGRGAWGQG